MESISSVIRTPLGVGLGVLILLILATLTAASALSGAFSNAAISAAGMVSIAIIIWMINRAGK